jgi:hypothetical protein
LERGGAEEEMSLQREVNLGRIGLGHHWEWPGSEKYPSDKSPSNIIDIVLRFAVPLGFDSLHLEVV